MMPTCDMSIASAPNNVNKQNTKREEGGVVVRVSDLGSKGPGLDARAVPKSECMFVNIYRY